MTSLKKLLLFALCAVLLGLGGTAFAADADNVSGDASHQGESAHDEHGAAAINWLDLSDTENPPLIPEFINIIAVVFLVYFLLRKGLGAKIGNRKNEYEAALAQANALKKEAEEAMAEARRNSDRLEAEMNRIRAAILDSAKAQAAQIEAEAALRAERITGEASTLVAREVAMMATDIRREVVEEIVAMAEKQITDKLTGADHDKLAKEYVSSVMMAVQTGKQR